MDAITRAQKHIDTLEPAVSGSGGHAATFRACRILVNDYNLSLEEAWPILLSFNARCEPPWNEKELRRKLEDAARRPKGNYGTDKSQGRKKPEPATLPPSKRIAKGPAKYNPPPKAPTGPPPVPQLDSSVIATLAEKGAPVLSRYFLANISATDPAIVTPDMYLRALFDTARGEKTIIFADRKTQGQCLWPDQAKHIPTAAPDGIIFLGQPVDGFFRVKDGKKSRRSSECVLTWRHALLESDQMDDVKQWLQALITLPLPIVSITFSGSRSLHVLFRLEAATHEEWRGYVPDKARLSPHWRGRSGPHKPSCHAAPARLLSHRKRREKASGTPVFQPAPHLAPPALRHSAPQCRTGLDNPRRGNRRPAG